MIVLFVFSFIFGMLSHASYTYSLKITANAYRQVIIQYCSLRT